MRKILAAALAVLVFAVTGCGAKNAPNTIKDNKKLEDVIAAVDAEFKNQYGEQQGAVTMPLAIESEYLVDFCQIDTANVDTFVGNASMSMTNSDVLLAVKAKPQKVEAIKTALEKRLTDIQNQYEMYNVSGSYDRALAGEVYQKGDYVFLIIVGALPEGDAPADFDGDVQRAKTVIDGMFN